MPAEYTDQPLLDVGDPIRASWIALLVTALNLFDARFSERAIPLQAAVAGMASATFVDVPYPVDWVPVVSGEAVLTVYSKATNAATPVQLQLYDVTASEAVTDSVSTAVTDTADWAVEPLTVAVEAGHAYRLQIAGSDALNPVIGYATIL